MNYGEIKCPDIANGPGCRVSLFVSGCTHHCKGCFNSETWDFHYGKLFTDEVKNSIIEMMGKNYISGLTILGGEPMEPQNQPDVLDLIKQVRTTYPDKTIWIYSGYMFEELMGNPRFPHSKEILGLADVLVDGEFVESLKDISLRFRGSSNQRIIDLKETMDKGKVIPWEEN